jgi:predicted MFS family arabinose efflux permease
MVAGGAGLIAAGLALAVLTHVWQAFILVQGLMGLGFFLLHGVLQARATEMLPQARATAVASFAFALFLGQSIGALAMGRLIGALGYRGAFMAEAVAVLLLGAWLFSLLRRRAG